ncbi:MAG: hypothetical protein M1826_003885 [Phylliscum demangeonii]|nr:MAG: hypothetical protein M1826_003885 [Phylliscum demangeonii]
MALGHWLHSARSVARHDGQLQLARRPACAALIRARRPASSSSSAAAAGADDDNNNNNDPSRFSPPASSLSAPGPSPATIQGYDPIQRSRRRPKQLPRSRYQFRPPKYYRGPLHPHQPPRASDPASRAFIPGPFSAPRLEQTYESTIAADLMTLAYQHHAPGWRPVARGPRLRVWDASSPYHAGRPARGPRGGGDYLSLIRRHITFRNVPRLTRVTVQSFVRGATWHSAPLHAAGMAIQAITSVRTTACRARRTVSQWKLRAGKYVAVKADLTGEDMYHFLTRCVDLVLPRVKDWPGVKASSGDSSGNLSFGLTPQAVRLFPEIEINYDMYPPDMIPGCHITIHTSATNDRDARLLLGALGFPFYGKRVN